VRSACLEGGGYVPGNGHLVYRAPVEECHTGSFLLLLRFLRSCGALGPHTPVVTYRIPGTQVSLPLVVGFVEEPVYVRLSGAKGGEPIGTLALCMGVCGLFNHLPHQSEVSTLRSLRKTRKKRRK
jgi:hypothetical protein